MDTLAEAEDGLCAGQIRPAGQRECLKVECPSDVMQCYNELGDEVCAGFVSMCSDNAFFRDKCCAACAQVSVLEISH